MRRDKVFIFYIITLYKKSKKKIYNTMYKKKTNYCMYSWTNLMIYKFVDITKTHISYSKK